MTKMSSVYIKIVLLSLVLILVLFSGCIEETEEYNEPTGSIEPTISERSYLLGIGFWTVNPSEAYVNESFNEFLEGAEVAYIQITDNILDETIEPHVTARNDLWLEKARENGLKTYLALECLSGDRSTLRPLPNKKVKTFSDPEFREAYKAQAVRRAEKYKPDYLNLCVEINMLPKIYEEIDDFVSLYNEMYDAVKEVSPDSKVFVSYQYEILSGGDLSTTKKVQWDLIDKIGGKQDLIGISSYPRIFNAPYDPNNLPKDYYKGVSEVTDKKIFFAEIGAYSSDKIIPPSTQDNQAQFIVKFAESIEDMNVEAVMWIILRDLPPLPILKAAIPSQFFTLGLKGPNGENKESWLTWNKLKEIPLTEE